MLKRISVIFFLTAGLSLINACWWLIPCRCPEDEPPFIRLISINATIDNQIVNSTSETAAIRLGLENYDFISYQCAKSAALYACSCLGAGYEGIKYPLVDYDIRTDRDYNDLHPAGSSVKDLCTIGFTSYDYNTSTSSFVEIDQGDTIKLFWNEIIIQLDVAPDSLNTPYSFEVVLYDTQADSFTATTNLVSWY